MESIKKSSEKFYSNKLEHSLKTAYVKGLKNEKFASLVNKFELSDEIGMKYTSKLETVIENLKNCENCNGLNDCKNKVNGCVYYPKKNGENLDFNYVACKYKNKFIEESKQNKTLTYGLSSELANATMSNVDINDGKRVELIKCLKKFYDEYPQNKKGIYLHGSFGSGKTYLIAAILNELAKKNYKTVIMYYPEMLSRLKSTFDNTENSYSNMFDTIKTCDILLIDDIGAETVSNWNRDEILGTILQYRMENNLSTFFTSNLNLQELETHLSIVKNNTDKVKARRIIERIKQLTQDIELISKNRRN